MDDALGSVLGETRDFEQLAASNRARLAALQERGVTFSDLPVRWIRCLLEEMASRRERDAAKWTMEQSVAADLDVAEENVERILREQSLLHGLPGGNATHPSRG